jgi:hypothetical protein
MYITKRREGHEVHERFRPNNLGAFVIQRRERRDIPTQVPSGPCQVLVK